MVKRIMNKIKSFANCPEKGLLIKNRVMMTWQRLVYGMQFGMFGVSSLVVKPIRVLGKKHINIHNNVMILNGARMEVITQRGDEKYNASIEIDDNVSIGQNFHIISASSLVIGKDTTISGNVLVTNVDHEYRDIGVHVLQQDLIVKETRIGEHCFIGFGASIQAGTVLGKQCIVGANSVVRGVFDDYSVIVGAPARVVKRYNSVSGQWERI